MTYEEARRTLPGKKVRVKKGAEILTTGQDRTRIAKRAYVVTVDHVLYWQVVGVTVRWAGRGGYWNEAPLSDVEVLP